MDKYIKLMAVKGLIMSMDEQLLMRFEKDNLPENVKKVIVDKYYDAILEQIGDKKRRNLILKLHKQGVISEEQKMELLYPKHENVGDETERVSAHYFNIIVNGKQHVIHTPEENQTIDWEKIVLLSDLAKTGKEILTITFTYDEDASIQEAGGVLEICESIEVKEGMIFNVKKEK